MTKHLTDSTLERRGPVLAPLGGVVLHGGQDMEVGPILVRMERVQGSWSHVRGGQVAERPWAGSEAGPQHQLPTNPLAPAALRSPNSAITWEEQVVKCTSPRHRP